MLKVHRRLHILEQLPRFHPPPGLLEQIKRSALSTLSQEELDVLGTIAEEQAAGLPPREWSERESAALMAWDAALNDEARRMGLKSLPEVKQSRRKKQ